MSASAALQPKTIERTLAIAASPSAVWRAIVEPEIAPKWMGMRIVCTWEVGSPIALADTPLGPKYEERGTLLAFEPGRLLRYDHWSRLWRVPDGPSNRAVLTFELTPEGEGTRLHFTHALPAVEALAEHSDFFWRVGLATLQKLLEA